MSNPSMNCCLTHKKTHDEIQKKKSTVQSKIQSTVQSIAQKMTNKASHKRLRLHELDNRFGCSIIGTCVTLAELQKIRQKAKLFLHERVDDYDLHRIFVGVAGEKSYANKRLHKLLDQKYKLNITEFSKAHSQESLSKLWKQAVKKGDVAGAFWALLTHPHSQNDLVDKVYGEVHMLSHLSGASIRVDMQELTILRQENKRLKAQQIENMSKNKKSLYAKKALIHKQEKQLQKLQVEVNALKVAASEPSTLTLIKNKGLKKDLNTASSEEVSQLSTELYYANSKLMRLEQKSASTFVQNTEFKKQQTALQSELQLSNEDNGNLKKLLDQYLNPNSDAQCQSAKYCDNSNLEGKCILYVGGRDRQCSHFRALVEHYNGRFIHHDGGKSDGSSKLYSTLAQADAVLCPLDCISHEAMINVKKHCKNVAKPLVMMPRSSYSAFSKGLSQII